VGGITEALVQEECLKLHEIDLMFNEAVFLQGKEKAVGLSEEEQRRGEDLVTRLGESWNRVIHTTAYSYTPGMSMMMFFSKN